MREQDTGRNYKFRKIEAYFYFALFLGWTTVVNAMRSCYEWFIEHDVLFSTITWIIILIRIFYLVFHKRKWRKKIKDVVFFAPPKDVTAAEVAVIDAWWPTWRVFPAMLYDWVAKKNVRLWRTHKWEIYFEKITDHPFLYSDAKYMYAEHSAYNRDPEHDFWELCFATRTRVTIKMLMRMSVIERLPQDFFYQVQRQCLDRDTYKREVRPLLNISFEIASWTTFAIVCFYMGAQFFLLFPIMISLACLIRIVSLYIDMKRWNKYYYLTNKWIKIFEEVQWFKKYLLAVEDSKLKVVLKQDPTYFEKILPYAIAYWVWDWWLDKCFAHLQYDIFGWLVSDNDGQLFKSNHGDLLSFVDEISNTISYVWFNKNYTWEWGKTWDDLLKKYKKNYSKSEYSQKRI